MKIALGSDHGGYKLKTEILQFLVANGYDATDMGCHSEDSVDYPDFAHKVCTEITAGRFTHGILVCGTGIGMSIAANRFRDIRAALCSESFSARMSREHNDANVLCLGDRVLGVALALDIVNVWLKTEFAGGRHLRRIKMMG